MPGENGNDHAVNEPPLVLQNLSATSRQTAGIQAEQTKGWGWGGGGGWGWANKNKASVAPQESSQPPSRSAEISEPSASAVGASSSLAGSSMAQSPSNDPSKSRDTTSNKRPTSPKTSSRETKQSSSLSPSIKFISSSIGRRRGRELDKEEEFLMETQEKRKSSESGPEHDHLGWYEEDLQQRLDRLNKDEAYALGLLDRRRITDSLTKEELEDLELLARERADAINDEEELNELLDRKDDGEPINEGRLYHLELRSRQRLGQKLTSDEEEDLKLLEDARQEELADLDELNELLDARDDGEDVDSDRLYELELFERKRMGGKFSKEEARDLEFFERKRQDVKLDLEEFEELLDMKDQGESVDEERFYVLELVDKRCNNKELSGNELEDLAAYDAAKSEEHLDRIEFNALREARESGELVADDRLRSLELLEKKRQGRALSKQEVRVLENFELDREQVKLDEQELAELLDKKLNGEDFDEDRLYLLDLLDRKREDEELTGEELHEMELFEKQRRQDRSDAQELSDLLDKKDRDTLVDEDRLHELQLRGKESLGETLTDAEIEDLELFEQVRLSKLAEQSQDGERSMIDALDPDEMENGEDLDDFDLGSQDLRDAKRLQRDFEKEGLPSMIKFGRNDEMHSSRISVASIGEDSYIQDLLSQRERREEDRREETLEEALELYQVALKDKNVEESEKLFMMIFDELLKESTEKAKDDDKKQDAFIDSELKMAELRELQRKRDNHEELEGQLQDDNLTMASDDVETEEANDAELFDDAKTRQLEEEKAAREAQRLKQEQDANKVHWPKQEQEVAAQAQRLEQQETVAKAKGIKEEQEAAAKTTKLREEQEAAAEDRLVEEEQEAAHRLEEEQEAAAKAKGIKEEQEAAAKATNLKEEQEAAAESRRVAKVQETAQRLKEEQEAAAKAMRIKEEQIAAAKATKLKEEQEAAMESRLVAEVQEAAQRLKEEQEAAAKAMRIKEEQEAAAKATKLKEEQDVAVEARRVAEEQEVASKVQQFKQEQEDIAQQLKEAQDGELQTTINGTHAFTNKKDEVCSEDECIEQSILQEQHELDELNDLYDRQDRGEDIDEDRLYELELFDRDRQGEKLNSEELDDLEFFRSQRELYDRFRRELETLMGRESSGDSVDKDRLYFLHLADKKRRRQELSIDELGDLEEFIGEEEKVGESTNAVISINTGLDIETLPSEDAIVEPSKRRETETLISSSEEKKNQALVSVAVQQEDTVSSSFPSEKSSEHVVDPPNTVEHGEDSNQGVDNSFIFPGDSKGNESDNGMNAKIGFDFVKELGAQGSSNAEVVDKMASNDLFSFPNPAALTEGEGEQETSDSSFNQQAVPGGFETFGNFAVEADLDDTNVGIPPNNLELLGVADREVEGIQSTQPGLDLQEHDGIAADENLRVNGGAHVASDAARAHTKDDNDISTPELQAAPSCCDDDEKDKKMLHQEEIELNELNELYDRQDRGDKIDLDRLYKLELNDRLRQGEQLSPAETDDLNFFKERPEIHTTFENEDEHLRLRKEMDEHIDKDQDRVFDLELVRRKQVGESFEDDELNHFEAFIVEEENASNNRCTIIAYAEEFENRQKREGELMAEDNVSHHEKNRTDPDQIANCRSEVGLSEKLAVEPDLHSSLLPVETLIPRVVHTESTLVDKSVREEDPVFNGLESDIETATQLASLKESADTSAQQEVAILDAKYEAQTPSRPVPKEVQEGSSLVSAANESSPHHLFEPDDLKESVFEDKQRDVSTFDTSTHSENTTCEKSKQENCDKKSAVHENIEQQPSKDSSNANAPILTDVLARSTTNSGEDQGIVDDCRSIVSMENDELTDLLDRHERGEDIDEERLYELELNERQRRDDTLSDQELQDFEIFQQRREKDLKHEKEFMILLEEKDAGRSVDEDRFYFLDLLDRKRHGEELDVDELEDLYLMLEADEEANKSMSGSNHEKSSTFTPSVYQSNEENRSVEATPLPPLEGKSIVEDERTSIGIKTVANVTSEKEPQKKGLFGVFPRFGVGGGDSKGKEENECDTTQSTKDSTYSVAENSMDVQSRLCKVEVFTTGQIEETQFQERISEPTNLANVQNQNIEVKSASNRSASSGTASDSKSEQKKAVTSGWGTGFFRFGSRSEKVGEEGNEEEQSPVENVDQEDQIDGEEQMSLVEEEHDQIQSPLEGRNLIEAADQRGEEESVQSPSQKDEQNSSHIPPLLPVVSVSALDELDNLPTCWQSPKKSTELPLQQDLIEKDTSLHDDSNLGAQGESVENQMIGTHGKIFAITLEENMIVSAAHTSDSLSPNITNDATPAIATATEDEKYQSPIVEKSRPTDETDEVGNSEVAEEECVEINDREEGGTTSSADLVVTEDMTGTPIDLPTDREDPVSKTAAATHSDDINDSSRLVGFATGPSVVDAEDGLSQPGGGMLLDEDHETCLLDKFRQGEGLSADELFELKAFSKRRQGIQLDAEQITELNRLDSVRNEKRNKDKANLEQLQALKSLGENADGDLFYELELLERKRNDIPMSEDELTEVELFTRRRTGESLADSEVDILEVFKQGRIDERLDTEELSELREQLVLANKVDEDRLYELVQKEKRRERKDLTKDELYELSLFDRLQIGDDLADTEMDDLDMFRLDRLDLKLEKELHELERQGENVEPKLLFELRLFERRRLEELLNEDELQLLALLERQRLGDRMIEEETVTIQELLHRLGPQKKDEVYMLDQIDREYRKSLFVKKKHGEELDGDEVFELEVLDRADEGDFFTGRELEELESLRVQRDQRAQDKEELKELRRQKKASEEFDENMLYELELFERKAKRETLNVDERFELDLFARRRSGKELLPDELDELDMIRRQRELRALDEKDLVDLLDRNKRGEEIDEDLLYELQVFDKHRKGEETLNDDELFELDMFEKRREGHILNENELEDLEMLKKNRKDIALEDAEIREIKAKRDGGNLIDGDMLYELELFYRKHIGEELTKNELFEIGLFEKRRAGGELNEDELDELGLLKTGRFENVDEVDLNEDAEEDDDSAHIRLQRKRLQTGQRLHKNELVELDILERQKKGNALTEDELDELEILRQERRKLHASQDFQMWEFDEDDEDSASSRSEEETEKKKKKKKKKKPKEKKTKEKRLRRKKSLLIATESDVKSSSEASKAIPKEISKTKTTRDGLPPLPHPVPTPKLPSVKEQSGSKKGIFGGMFGRKSKKELELEDAKRRQEELIKEQLRGMQMQDQLEQMEKDKEMQEILVQEAMESKSKAVSVSSWETDTSYEESEIESEEESFSGDSSLASDESSASECLADGTHTVGELTIHNSIGPKSALTVGSIETWSDDGPLEPMMSTEPLPAQRMKSLSIESSIKTPGEGNSGEITSSSLPPKQITTHRDQTTDSNLDALSTVSDASSFVSVSANPREEKPLPHPLPPTETASKAKPDGRTRKAKVVKLSGHLRRQKKEQKKKDKEKRVGRHGDEISLGTAGLKSQQHQDELKPMSPKLRAPNGFEGGDDHNQPVRPWRSAVPGRRLEFLGSLNEEPTSSDSKEREKKDFFEENQHVFDHSVFNFNQSFASKISEGSDGKSEGALSAVAENESVTSHVMEKQEDASANDDGDFDESKFMESVSTLADQSFTLFGYGAIESKLAGKMRDKEEEFNEAWATIEADKAVAAQMNQRRMMRMRERATGREEKKDEGFVDIPRLFLFEGEKVEKKKRSKRKKKERKKQRKLDNTLSKEFRRAMRDVFDSESEEEYDKTFGEADDGDKAKEEAPKSVRSKRRLSNDSVDDSDAHTSDSNQSEDMGSEEFDDDYLKRLREKSMQQEVKEILYEKKSEDDGSEASDGESQTSEISRGRRVPQRSDSGSVQSSKSATGGRRRKLRKNRSGEIVGEGIDPADVYAQELRKKRERNTFTISDLKKEMDEMRQGAPPTSFGNFAGVGVSANSFGMNNNSTKLKNPPALKSKRFGGKKSPRSMGPGVNSLRALNENTRPGLGGRQNSFGTQATGVSGQGLLGGGRKGFDSSRKGMGGFDIGGNLASVPTIDEDDEEAFLSGDVDGFDTGGINDNSVRTGRLGSSPGRSTTFNTRFGSALSNLAGGFGSPGGFGGNNNNSPGPASAGGGLNGAGFQEPLPLPEMHDGDGNHRKRGLSIGKLAGKMKQSVRGFNFGRKKGSAQDMGMLGDDPEDGMEGGLLG